MQTNAERYGCIRTHKYVCIQTSDQTLKVNNIITLTLRLAAALPPMAPKRRGGGVWQRQRAIDAAEPQPQSELAFYLVTQVLWGAISAEKARMIATMAKRDIEKAQEAEERFSFRELDMLASLSQHKTYQQLVRRISSRNYH